MYTLVTLDQVRAGLGLASGDTGDDPRLLAAAAAATATIERAAGRRFIPRQKAIQHTFTSALELLLDDDLLELTGLTNGDSTPINPADVIPVPEDAPYGCLRLTGGSAFTWAASPLQAITVTGVWGWHDRPAQMWRLSGDTVQNNPLTASATSLSVTDADGADSEGGQPRFQVGQLLKLESEYLWLTAVNTVSNTLTVTRAANGSAAVSHALNTAVYVYQPPAELNALALRWAQAAYQQADAPTAHTAALLAADDASLASLRRLGVKV